MGRRIREQTKDNLQDQERIVYLMKGAHLAETLLFLNLVKTQAEEYVMTCLIRQVEHLIESDALISKNWLKRARSMEKRRISMLPRQLMSNPRNIIPTILTISEYLSQIEVLILMKMKRMRAEVIN